MSKGKSPAIVLPEREERKLQLYAKLEEYKRRLGKRSGYSYMDTILKIRVLERLLKDKRVKTHKLSLELSREFGSDFDVERFDNACGVIENYCLTGGERAHGGTGLPPFPQQSNP